ncbi:flavodoxin family protein [Tepidibacter formicigenes]|jgi:multimeric flavodoxin WrbA|uniref:NADPH-dependent FMN reductase n=1 Tax=Tepidibacter formicigenes DSM 15518 TaxID=1123349 RepID=A0A1M6P553_9FIRM|nr:flavodoxin family protein [Tepidibacter formicigenes]SHK03040.1 NADPH-dependent FMN reductase [Tepidibacter formicigenes DSM 15518]
MTFLLINASPRKGKNCYQVLENVKNVLDDNNLKYKVLNIYDLSIEYCNACGYCEKTGFCHINDDMKNLYKEFNNSIGTIVISPVYFDSVPAKLKTLIDRTQAFYASKYILKKSSIDRNKYRVGMFISIGGSKAYKTQFLGGEVVVDFFFKSINTKLIHKYYITDSDKIQIKNNIEALECIKNLTLDLMKRASKN